MYIISKIIIVYAILHIIFKIYRRTNKKKIVNKSTPTIATPLRQHINEHRMVVYGSNINKKLSKNKYNLFEIYDNFINKKKKKLVVDMDLSLLKNTPVNCTVDDLNNNRKDIIIHTENKINIELDSINNFIIYNFESKENCYYKIKCKLYTQNVKNIKLIISNDKKRFVYDFCEHNLIDKEINEYGFILDNNIFENSEKISVYVIFCDIYNSIKINNIFIEITEKKIDCKNDPIIIFDVNGNYYPLYFTVSNILDYIEYTNKNSVFFI